MLSPQWYCEDRERRIESPFDSPDTGNRSHHHHRHYRHHHHCHHFHRLVPLSFTTATIITTITYTYMCIYVYIHIYYIYITHVSLVVSAVKKPLQNHYHDHHHISPRFIRFTSICVYLLYQIGQNRFTTLSLPLLLPPVTVAIVTIVFTSIFNVVRHHHHPS